MIIRWLIMTLIDWSNYPTVLFQRFFFPFFKTGSNNELSYFVPDCVKISLFPLSRVYFCATVYRQKKINNFPYTPSRWGLAHCSFDGRGIFVATRRSFFFLRRSVSYKAWRVRCAYFSGLDLQGSFLPCTKTRPGALVKGGGEGGSVKELHSRGLCPVKSYLR